MNKLCRHCGSPCSATAPEAEFCCGGCEQVYKLIRTGGLEGYYKRQDRAGQPIGDEPFAEIDPVLMGKLQRDAEGSSGSQLTLGVHGMSCMACAWLVEQLAGRQAGVVFVKVAPDSNRFHLRWERPHFDLYGLALELRKFGYRITGEVEAAGPGLSPLAIRSGLTAVFSLNGVFLVIASKLGVGGADLQLLLKLLIAACLFFSLQIGGTVFLKPVRGALSLGRLHKDLPVALAILLLFVLSLGSLFYADGLLLFNILYFLLLVSSVSARWLFDWRAMKQLPS